MSHAELVERGREIVQGAKQAYIDLDVEADGIPGFGSLLSIGAVSPWNDEFYVELRPTSSRCIPEQREFCEEHGLQRERLLVEGEEPHEAVRQLAKWVIDIVERNDKAEAKLTAFNASFDYPWIDLAAREAGIENPFGVTGFCIKSLALALSDTYNWRDTSRNEMPEELIPEGDFTHNALEDARYQQKMHYALAAKIDALRYR